jgi:dolichol-phosphate mannosyltransferase
MQVNQSPLFSIVSPIYRGEKMLRELVDRITSSVSPITSNYEIILVNDASPDQSWAEIEKACAIDKHVKGINLSRNFGQHYAISAGLYYAKGDWVVVMDCDLQDRPEEIPNLYRKALEGWDIVRARRMNKQFGFFKKLSSTVYHKVFDWLSGQKTDPAIGNFGIYSKEVIAEFNKMPEVSRSFETLLSYLGFKRTDLDVQHAARAEGSSSYTLRKLLSISLNISISNTNKPLRVAVTLGLLMSVVSFIFAIYDVIAKWMGLITVPGYTTTIFSIWFVGGLILFIMGILGLYISKIFDQVKGRQLYIIRDMINFDKYE